MGINSFAPANRVEAAVAKSSGTLGPIVLGAGLTVPISAVDLWVTEARFYGYKTIDIASPPTNNAGPIAIGPYVGGVAKLVDVIQPGGTLIYAPGIGTKFNLKDLAATGTGADSVVVVYVQ
jgi:hypothetical protein